MERHKYAYFEGREKVKSSVGSGMETDQGGQLDMLLNQFMKVLNKNYNIEEADASLTSK